jgi:hypothetical protein
MERAKYILKFHWPGLLLALFLGVNVLLPHLLLHLDPSYQGIELMDQDSEEHYIARVNEIYKGDYVLGNTFLPEKDKPYLQPPLGEIIQAWVGKAFFLDAPRGVLASKFIFPFLTALVLYALLYLVSKSRTAGLLGTTIAIVGFNLVSSASAWIMLLHGTLVPGSYTIFARPINPAVSSLIMFAALAVLYRALFLKEKAKVWEVIFVGVCIGVSAYINPYTFTFTGLLVALLFGWYLFKKEWGRAKTTFGMGLIGLLTTIPFFINYEMLHKSAEFAALAARQGLVSDRHPVISAWLLMLLPLILFVWPKAYKRAQVFFVASVLSLLILTDQNVLTGYTLHPSHYHWYITKPFIGIVLGIYAAWILNWMFKDARRIKIICVAAALFVLCYTSPLLHIPWNLAHPSPQSLEVQKFAPVIAAINMLPEKQVVWADPKLSLYVSIYSAADAPNNPFAIYYLNPRSFYENALFLNYRLRGETPATILASFIRDRTDVSGWIDGLYWRQAKGDLAAIPDEELADLAQKYAMFYARPYYEAFADLHITSVVAPTNTAQTYTKIESLKLLGTFGDYNLYTLTD